MASALTTFLKQVGLTLKVSQNYHLASHLTTVRLLFFCSPLSGKRWCVKRTLLGHRCVASNRHGATTVIVKDIIFNIEQKKTIVV